MSIPSNGITPEVIRGAMAPYLLSLDLLHATFAALPAPPPDATATWRRARVTRLAAEIVAPMPANADQARIAAQLLIARELADTFAKAARAPDLTSEQMCRLGRTASGLMRTAIELDRSLARHQQKPAPFFGTVDDHEVDLAEVDTMWGGRPGQPPPASPPGQPPSDTAPPPAQTDPSPEIPTPPNPETRTAPGPQPQPDLPLQPDHADGTPEWAITKLDEGPGWSREVLRHRSSNTGGNGTAPGSSR